MRRSWTPLSAGVCAFLCTLSVLLHRRRGSREIDVFVASLKCYPIKSTAPIELTSSMVGPRGLDNDRRWMIVDDAHQFVTGRQEPRLTLVRVNVSGSHVTLAAPGMPEAFIELHEGRRLQVQIWKQSVTASLVSEQANAWLTRFLGRQVKLVSMPADVSRPVREDCSNPGDAITFADSFPVMLLSEAAVDALSKRQGSPVDILRFRPNIIVRDVEAHEEDRWRRIAIGDCEFDVARPCTRCAFVNVDPATGQMDAQGEPLRTLARYRRQSIGVTFGQHLLPRRMGRINVGDEIIVLE